MNELERFKTVVNFEKPDYWPLIVTMAGYMIGKGGMIKLHREGMPEWVNDNENWCRYWGQGMIDQAEHIGAGKKQTKEEKWIEGDFEYTRYESGALIKRVKDHETNYSMPEFIEFAVRDRASFERLKTFDYTYASKEKLAAQVKKFKNRSRPLLVQAGRTWGMVRDAMGPERALYAIYDDPALVRDMISYQLHFVEQFVFPVIEALRPEAVNLWEDFCYNHGLMFSPAVFREFCAPYYKRVAAFARDCGVKMLVVDTDGKVDEFCLLLEEFGFNAIWPLEQVCGNPLLEYRKRQPNLIMSGGIEKEITNSGNGDRIEPELSKLPPVLEKSGYFPSFDHALQIIVGFEELCRTMTRLHEICGSAELGEFPRKRGQHRC